MGSEEQATKQKKAIRCVECGQFTKRMHPILDVALHSACQRINQHKYQYITKSRALGEYRLRKGELTGLSVYEVDNPYYKKAAPMQLYLHSQVRELARAKWNTYEPYIVTLQDFSDESLTALSENPEHLKLLTPGKFQNLIADRLECMGLEVQLVGEVFRKDGGMDIIAYPRAGNCAFPFLLGVQVKHHRTAAKTGSPDIRDFHGVLNSRSSPFHIGMIVTNTDFTADARWFAKNNSTLIRLRDLKDLRRWLKNDFVNENEWREIPEQIELAPGIRITISKPKFITEQHGLIFR